MATVRQPFVVGLSQVGGTDTVGDRLELSLSGFTASVTFGTLTPAPGTARPALAGLAVTVTFGTLGGAATSGPFTVGTSQVGGVDLLGLTGALVRPLTAFNVSVTFGAISGGASHLNGYRVPITFGSLSVVAGNQGTFGYAHYGDGVFGGIAAPVTTAAGAFTVGQSQVGGDDQLGGAPAPSAQTGQLGGLAVPVTFGAPIFTLYANLTGLAVPIHFGELSPRGTGTEAIGLHGFTVPVTFGTLTVVGHATLTGLHVGVTFGAIVVRPTLAGFVVPIRFGTYVVAGGTVALDLAGFVVAVSFGTIAGRVAQPIIVTRVAVTLTRQRAGAGLRRRRSHTRVTTSQATVTLTEPRAEVSIE